MSLLLTSPVGLLNCLTDVRGVLEWWEEFRLALPALNKLATGPWKPLTEEQWLSYLLHVTANPLNLTAVVTSRNGKPLGLGVCEHRSDPVTERQELFVFFTYSNGKSTHAVQDLMWLAESHCRKNGIRLITAQTTHTSGAAIRWFEQKMGFRRSGITFYKEL